MLPVRQIQDDITRTLQQSQALILAAPTGSGKSTQVPQILLEGGLHADLGILVLQPRRLAARMLARRVAQERGCRLGDEVGFQVRHDSAWGPYTRIRFVTEGIFLRLLQEDPQLRAFGAVVMDEFHERSWQADLALMAMKTLLHVRPELRLVVMSATLDTQALGSYLACPVLQTQQRLHPVTLEYQAREARTPLWEAATTAVVELLRQRPSGEATEQGHILVFMPGLHEIRRTCSLLQERLGSAVAVHALHAELSPAQQDAAVDPSAKTKVIVATNVAETSLTIDGVTAVVDAGQARISGFDPQRGLGTLLVQPISRASADQRAGRAGRTAPGRCIRLWSRSEHERRPERTQPEIHRMDLSELILHLKALGVPAVQACDYFEAPRSEALVQALELMRALELLDEDEALTPMGSFAAALPLSPRLGALLWHAGRLDCLEEAALAAAIISEQDILGLGADLKALASRDELNSDLFLSMSLWREGAKSDFAAAACQRLGLKSGPCRSVAQAFRQYCSEARAAWRAAAAEPDPAAVQLDLYTRLGMALVHAFADHLAVRRDEGTLAVTLSRGRRGTVDADSSARRARLVLAVELIEVSGRDGAHTKLRCCTELDEKILQRAFPQALHNRRVTLWNEERRAAEEREQRLFFDLVLAEKLRPAQGEQAEALLAAELRAGRLKLPLWDEEVDAWLERCRHVARIFPEQGLITYDADEIAIAIGDLVAGASSFNHIKERPVLPFMMNLMSAQDQAFVQRMAPGKLDMPSGRKARIRYEEGRPPFVSVLIQDLFGLDKAPEICAGRSRLLLEILAPNRRPVQVTEDLAAFWSRLYPELKPALSRRYPKHKWI